MKNKNNINESNKFTVHVGDETLLNPSATQKMANIQRTNPNVEFDLDPKNNKSKSMAQMEESDTLEPEAVIAPQDDATIKYLSNVIDNKTGEISQPFTIGAQKYQMIRGLAGKDIVMAVFAHDELDDAGNNIIHTIEEFEQKIALPAKQKLEMESKAMEESSEEPKKEETYEGCKHFLVDTKTNKVRKFKTIEELLSANKTEDEVYMGGPKFKKYMTERLFGKRKKMMNELGTEPINGDEDISKKAQKLMGVIDDNTAVQNAIKTIKTPDAQGEVIAAFAELIGVPRNGLSNLVSNLKDISKEPNTQQTNENVIITKKELVEAYSKKRNVIKTIKIKDIK